MLAIIDKFNDDEVTPMMLDDDAWFVTHAFNGNDELQFTFTEESGYYDLLEEESKVLAIGLRGRSNRFVVKNIDSHDGVVTVNCDIDLYDWQQTIFDTYGGGSARTLEKVLQDVTPSGWSYSGQEQFGKSEVFQSGSREPVKAGTPLDVLDLACEVYGCVFNFDNIAKHLYAIDPESYTPSGDFLSDEVNLKSVGYVGNSEGYATRLYPYGKRDDNGENPVTIESVNGGLPYVTNNEFSDDIICVGWSDERYTVPEHLKEAAILRLAELATPTRSYECDVSQLNRNVWLYMVLTMIDRKHRTRVDLQVVEWREYGRPDLDVVTLSATPPTFESIVSDGLTQDDVQDAINSNNNWIQGIIQDAIDNATDAITGNDGGYFRWIFDSEGRPIELVNLGDSMDINDAKQVWRWNAAGLGHSSNGYNGPYTMAMLADGSINASVITTGILNAGVIKAGVISDVLGRNFWNMETGEFSLSASTTIDGEPIVVSVDTQFAVNDSSITPPTSGWTTSLPTYDPRTQFLWSRTVTAYADGNVAYSGTICLTAQAKDGQDGLSVTGFVEQYYLSTSNETPVGGSWSTEQPEWQPDLFIWTRLCLTWSNETVTYTDPSLANALNSANQNAHDAEQAVSILDESLNQKGVFDRLTNNGQTQGIYLENGRIYINATYIATGTLSANLIKAGILTDSLGRNFWNMETGEFSLSASTTIDGEPVVVGTDTQFAVNTSSTNAPTTGWTTSQPSYDPDTQYLWYRVVTQYANGTTKYSEAVCLTAQSSSGQDGNDGQDGRGVQNVVDQYYLSTSSTTQSGGSWSTTQPKWQPNRYIWQRLYITWDDGTTSTTTPYLANALNSANQNAHDAEQAVTALDNELDQQEIFNRLTNNGQTQGIYLSGGKIYINGEYIRAGTVSTDRIVSSSNSSTKLLLSGSGTGAALTFQNSGETLFEIINFSKDAVGFRASDLYFIEVAPRYGSSGAYIYLMAPKSSSHSGATNPKMQLGEDNGFFVCAGDTSSAVPYLWLKSGKFNVELNNNARIDLTTNSFFIGTGSSGYPRINTTSTSLYLYYNSTHYIQISSSAIYCRNGSRGFGIDSSGFHTDYTWN